MRRGSTIGQRIKAARLALGISQARLGLEAGIADLKNANVRMSRYETDKHSPDEATLRAIADALHVPAAYLVCEDDQLAQVILGFHHMPRDQRDKLLKQLQRFIPDDFKR